MRGKVFIPTKDKLVSLAENGRAFDFQGLYAENT
jgi:hypothetical protein